MAATPSAMIELGTVAPHFNLPDTVNGKKMDLNSLKSQHATVIMFICNHCPYVKHIQEGLVKLTNEYLSKGISFVAINSNDVVNYPEDSPAKMKTLAQSLGFSFPYLYDETQEVAKAYSAECTPDFFIYDKNLKLVYRGQFDDSRPQNGVPITGKDVRGALDNILKGKEVSPDQKPSIGCNIKWKSS